MLDLVGIRQTLHQIPERAFCEFKTQKYLLSILKKIKNIKLHTLANSTGILVEYSNGSGGYKLFRAEMDGLGIEEKTGLPFKSKEIGMMHACGHDIHMATMIGFIEKIVEKEENINLLFLFQPAEEDIKGAKHIIKSGILDSFEIKRVYAMHVTSKYDVGEIATKKGTLFSVPMEFDIEIIGKSAHAAFKNLGENALKTACEVVLEIEKIKKKDRVINIGKIVSGKVRNAVAERAIICGTHRNLTEKKSKQTNLSIEKILKTVSQKNSCNYKIKYGQTTKPVVNNEKVYRELKKSLPNNIKLREAKVNFTADDFGLFTSLFKGLMFWIGSGISQEDIHSSNFTPQDRVIQHGINIFYNLVK